MKVVKLGKTDLLVSRIGLGTAEIGFAYGIGKRSLPTESEAINLLKQAIDLGITFFETAPIYGLAEERIGRSGILKNPTVVVATKCAHFLEKGENLTTPEIKQRIKSEVESSLQKLGLDCLPLLLLHGPSKEQIEKGELIEILNQLKREGKIRSIGIATRGEETPLSAIKSEAFDVIQIAYSLIDQRLATQVLPAASQAGIGVINRSVLLKGSLTKLRHQLPSGLEPLRASADRAEQIATNFGTDLPTLAIRFALNNPHISTVLIGTNQIENLTRASKAVEAGPLPEEIITQLEKLALTDPNQIDPAKWPKLRDD